MVLVPEEEGQGDRTFESLGLCPELCKACEELGWTSPTRIQAESIPVALKGKDIIGLAQTGSGKTGAFALPVINSLLVRKAKAHNVCLVLTPTRELAMQVCEDFVKLGQTVGLRAASLVGGVAAVKQAIELSKRPHVIVGTPGRVKDHLETTKGFNLRKLEFLILDEADQMLAMDYEKELNAILEVIPKLRQTSLFSATMTSKVEKLQKASLRDPVMVECAPKYSTVSTLKQQYIFVPFSEKSIYLHYFLSTKPGKSVLVFCDAAHVAQKLALTLRLLGHSALPLYGKLDQAYRLTALGKFKEGKVRILVCTDVAARGLNIPSVDVVINYALPLSVKCYIHRVGRTARAGAAGMALNVVTQYDVTMVEKIEEHIKLRFEELVLEEAKVMAMQERVEMAEREASIQIKEAEREGRGFKRKRDDDSDAAHLKESHSLSKRRESNEKKFGFNAGKARKELHASGKKKKVVRRRK